jgi:Trk K+ transport system NAD-binding subunit
MQLRVRLQVLDDVVLHVVVGDYFSENTLKRAAPERARKVMILADKTEGANGQIPTPTEVDARTIMTAMTLSTIAKNTVVTAEILDPKMDQYLRIANVSEIIYSRESNRLMLVNASAGTGITNIIFDLMDPKTNAFIATEAIDEKFLNRPYGELKEWYWKNRRSEILVGILENSGSKNSMKEWALKRAQKTTDVNRLLQNLAAVKVMKVNNPVFNPADDYVVPEGCMAIVVETKADESKGGAHARPQAAA